MSFLNKDNFDADALMDAEEDDYDHSQNHMAFKSNNILQNKVETSQLSQISKGPFIQKTSDTTQIHSQIGGVAHTAPYMKNQVQQQIINEHPQVTELKKKTQPGQAIRSEAGVFMEAEEPLQVHADLLQSFIIELNDLVKNNISSLYQNQFKQVLDVLMRAFTNQENNSLMLLSRSKQIIHSFLNQIEKEIVIKTSNLQQESKDSGQINQNPLKRLKVVRVNSILNNTEGKILQKFCESMNFNQASKSYTIEMIEQVQKYFEQENSMCLLFILEDIDFYIEQTKQIVLYKILDMLQYCKIPFVFLATSQKVDIVDSFEKRIKSRFSHRQILFYEEDFGLFNHSFNKLVGQYENAVIQNEENIQKFKLDFMNLQPEDYEQTFEIRKVAADYQIIQAKGKEYQNRVRNQRTAVDKLKDLIQQKEAQELLENAFDCGNGYEYMCQYLRIAFSNLNLKIKQNLETDDPGKRIDWQKVSQFVNQWWRDAIEMVNKIIYEAGEPEHVIRKLSQSSLQVLICAYKISVRAPQFNFEAVYQSFKRFIKDQQKSSASVLIEMSRQTFLKIFLDLVTQGFLRSENCQDILSVNNKVALGFRTKDFEKMLDIHLSQMNLPSAFVSWTRGSM